MEKKLPKVFANKIDRELKNNETVFYDRGSKEIKEEEKNNRKGIMNDTFSLNQKINKIFGSSRYVYKADVDITTKEGKISRRVIGRNKNELITMDNELIKISDILDIEFSDKE